MALLVVRLWTGPPGATPRFVDSELVRSCPRPPTHPMQMMLAAFDFPDKSTGDDHYPVPVLIVDHLRGYQP